MMRIVPQKGKYPEERDSANDSKVIIHFFFLKGNTQEI